jgi:glutathione S-transferase
MAVKLHRCSNVWVKLSGHPCWRVQKALDDAGVEYELVPGPLRRGKRDDLERLSGQRAYPVIEFEDGTVYREESAAMAETIRSGHLDDRRQAAASPVPSGSGDSTPPS